MNQMTPIMMLLAGCAMRKMEVPQEAVSDQSKEEAEEFINKPQMKEAVEMRRFDDQAKILNKSTPSVEHFRKYVENSFQEISN